MTDVLLTCAKCGRKKELCQSVTDNGIKQPRICKECLIEVLETGDESTNDIFWLIQLKEAGEEETLKKLLDD